MAIINRAGREPGAADRESPELPPAALLGRAVGFVPRWTLAAMAAVPSPPQLQLLRTAPADLHGDLLAFADRNGVGPLAAHALLDHHPSSPVADRAHQVHARSAARMRTLLDVLDDLATRLSDIGIPVVVMKNGGIARALHPCTACCPMGDLDLLVEERHFAAAHAELVAAGFAAVARGHVGAVTLDDAVACGSSEHRGYVDGEEILIDLQWRPVAGRWIRPEQETGADVLLARSVSVAGSAARLFAPLDNMVQVCLHTAKHSYVRAPGPRLHTDVDRLARWAPPDWPALVEEVTRLRSRTAVYLSLVLAQTLLDSPVPTEVLEGLRPHRVKRDLLVAWLRRTGMFEPGEVKFRRPDMLAFHALLYDDARTLASSALDTEPDELTWRRAPQLMASGARRLGDLATRYQQ